MLRNLNFTDSRAMLANYGNNFGRYMIIYGLMIINQAILLSLVFGYLKLYLEKGSGNFQLQDIFRNHESQFYQDAACYVACICNCDVWACFMCNSGNIPWCFTFGCILCHHV